MQNMVNWEGVHGGDYHTFMMREVDFTKILPETQEEITGWVWHGKIQNSAASETDPSSTPTADRQPAAAVSDYARTLDATARRAQERDPDRGIDR
jgi:hypothetical protein